MIPILAVVAVLVTVIVRVEIAYNRRRREFESRLSRWYDDDRVCRDVDD